MQRLIWGISGWFLLSSCYTFAQPPAQSPEAYFTVVPGNVPIVLTAGHGGTLSYPFPPRPCTGSQTCVTDTNTRLLTPRAADAFFDLTGLQPYMIVAQGDRSFIDLNRDKNSVPNDAFDDPLAEPFYDYYHDTVQGFIDEIKLQYGRGLLIDVHGQSSEPGTLIRGTKNGLTTTELVDEFGSPALNGINSIFGTFDALGYPVDPDLSISLENQVENPSYDGGYTVQAYGSHLSTGIDSIQIEFGIDFREDSNWEQTGDDLAIAMNNFYQAYLAQEPGDFDQSGAVNGFDFISWQRGVGINSGASMEDGDGNGDGIVDGEDLDIWRNNYGFAPAGTTASIAIPEPSCLVIGMFCVALSGVIKWNRSILDDRVLRSVLILAIVLPSASWQARAYAEVQTFTDLAAWEAALSGSPTLEDFEGATGDTSFGLAYQPTISPNGELGLRANANFSDNAAIDVSPYISSGADINGNVVVNLRFLDQGNGTNSQETVDVFLPAGVSAFAFEFNNYDINGDGTFLSFSGTNGGVVAEFDPSVDGFFGVVDTSPGATIKFFSFTGDPTSGTGTSAFNSFDDVRYGVAFGEGTQSGQIPEPSFLRLLGGLGIVLLSYKKPHSKRPLISCPRGGNSIGGRIG